MGITRLYGDFENFMSGDFVREIRSRPSAHKSLQRVSGIGDIYTPAVAKWLPHAIFVRYGKNGLCQSKAGGANVRYQWSCLSASQYKFIEEALLEKVVPLSEVKRGSDYRKFRIWNGIEAQCRAPFWLAGKYSKFTQGFDECVEAFARDENNWRTVALHERCTRAWLRIWSLTG